MFTVTHWWGSDERNAPEDSFPKILAEVASADREHPDCSLTHELGWSLSYSREHRLVFENVETGKRGEQRHMTNVTPETAAELWRHLARGDVAYVEKQSWKPGYG